MQDQQTISTSKRTYKVKCVISVADLHGIFPDLYKGSAKSWVHQALAAKFSHEAVQTNNLKYRMSASRLISLLDRGEAPKFVCG